MNTSPKEKRSTDNYGQFETTEWNVVLAASNPDSSTALPSLEILCQKYWYPLYSYARCRCYSEQTAQDMTQSFFATFLQKKRLGLADPARGRFRSFLLSSFKHFLASEWNRANAAKRGGRSVVVSLDAQSPEDRFHLESVQTITPETVYERNCAILAVERALNRVRREYAAAGKSKLFEALRLYLWDVNRRDSYATLAKRMGMSEAALRVAVMRLRQRCRQALRQEVAQMSPSTADVDDELRHLIDSLKH